MPSDAYAIDLFCGAGGLTYGLEREGIKVVAGIDNDPACRFPYEENTDAVFIEGDIKRMTSRDIEALYPKNGVRILAGCAPCQPFSQLGHKRDKKDDSDKKNDKWRLLNSFTRCIRNITPDIVTMENVPGLCRHEVFQDFLSALDKLEYQTDWAIRDCRGYGVPQSRRRLVLLASRLGKINMIPPICADETEYSTVRGAIGALSPLHAGEQDANDFIHEASRLSSKNLERIRASKPGGTWMDWPPRLRLECHKKPSGKSYTPVYGRMEWDKPSPTITTQSYIYGTGRFGHPEQDRAISFREAALLQTFPANYRFVPDGARVCKGELGRLIGNAVPVKLAEAIGRSIQEHLKRCA
ncbi:DNA cytosine methyltransferase [archaeon]